MWSVNLILPFWKSGRGHEQIAVVVRRQRFQIGRPLRFSLLIYDTNGTGGRGGRSRSGDVCGWGSSGGCLRCRRRHLRPVRRFRFWFHFQFYSLVLVGRCFQRTVFDTIIEVNEQAWKMSKKYCRYPTIKLIKDFNVLNNNI